MLFLGLLESSTRDTCMNCFSWNASFSAACVQVIDPLAKTGKKWNRLEANAKKRGTEWAGRSLD
jgi:hypothetical protein